MNRLKKLTFSVREVYPTIQGEGFLIGAPVTLIRFQGCNIYCPWCDTKEAIPFGGFEVSADGLLKRVEEIGRKHLLVTGGEPFAQSNFGEFCRLFAERGYFLQIETNGTLWVEELDKLPRDKFYFSVSPKPAVDYEIHPVFVKAADELKFVVDDRLTIDVLKREKFLPLIEKKKLILQPEGNKPEFVRKGLELVDQLLKEGLYARLIPQVHKLIDLP